MTESERRDLDHRLAVCVGYEWSEDTKHLYAPNGGDAVAYCGDDGLVKVLAGSAFPLFSESLDALVPVMAEIRKRGLANKWVAELADLLGLPTCHKLEVPASWLIANAPAEVRAQAALAVLEGK